MQNESSSVMAVFEAVASRGEISRAELSDITGFSLVTVGKAVDQLTACGVVEEYKRVKASAGRRSGVCSLVKAHGMLLLHADGKKCRVRICDLGLNVLHEFEAEVSDPTEMYLSAFGTFAETGRELFGVGMCVPCGMREKYAEGFRSAMGQSPELIIEEGRAYAAANVHRLDCHGMTVLVRLFENGSIDGALAYQKRLYSGAFGRAGGFGRIADSKESLISKLADICEIIDPEAVHIGVQGEHDCDCGERLRSRLLSAGIPEDKLPVIISEPLSLCRTPLDGAAMLLRAQIITMKLTKNS